MEVVGAASGSATHSSVVSQAVSQAKQALERATVKEVMDMAGADDAKTFEGSTWRDLNNAVRREDVKSAIANPAQTVQNIGKRQFRSTTDGAVDDQDEAGIDGNASLVVFIVLAGLILGVYVFFQRATKPRPVRVAILSGDYEQDSSAAASHWMGAGARDLTPNSPGGNESLDSRAAISNFEWLSRS